MADLLVNIGLILPFVSLLAFIVYRNRQYKWSRTKADKIIAGNLQADVSYINGIIEILRPTHFYTTRHEDDLYRVQQLREIRNKLTSQ